MIKQDNLQRILYAGAGLIISSTILFPVATVLYLILDKSGSATPESGIAGTVVIVILHLLILYAFREAIIVNKRGGHLSNIVYIAAMAGLLLLGLIILLMAVEFLVGHSFYLTTILLFICVGCDFVSSILALAALLLQPKKY